MCRVLSCVVVGWIAFVAAGVQPLEAADELPGSQAIGTQGAVCGGGAEAVAAGIGILKRGGNAADAAAGTILALSVTDHSGFCFGGEVPIIVYDARRRVVEVAKMADAHNFISAMPLGYEQIVGERGMGLSGGQVQRLCIARALYHDPRVLILDEATSALDSQSESNILRNMQEVLKGRTSIVIAHRLSTIINADKILVLYNGSIVEEGVHAELVDRRGMYHQLVQKQMMSAA